MDTHHQQRNVIKCSLKIVRDKENSSLVGRKIIATKLVLKIKLASNGSTDNYKVRRVFAGCRQTAGIDYENKKGSKRHQSEVEKSAGYNKFGLSAGLRFDSGRTPVNSNQYGFEQIDPQARFRT